MKTKITKKPKKVRVIWTETVSYISEYKCPSCSVYIVGAGIGKHITRFKCGCGQELIVESSIKGD
jgi:hypothetical protein